MNSLLFSPCAFIVSDFDILKDVVSTQNTGKTLNFKSRSYTISHLSNQVNIVVNHAFFQCHD